MATLWSYSIDGEQHGPISSAELKRLADAGQIGPDDWVRRDGDDTWLPASRVKGLFDVGSADASSVQAPPSASEPEAPPAANLPPVAAPPPDISASGRMAIVVDPAAKQEAGDHPPEQPALSSKAQRQKANWIILGVVAALALLVPIAVWIVNLTTAEPEEAPKQSVWKDNDREKPVAASTKSDGDASKPKGPVRLKGGMDKPLTLDGVAVEITQAAYDHPWVRMSGADRRQSPKAAYLVIDLRLTHQGESPAVEYVGWGSMAGESLDMELTDDRNRVVHKKRFPGAAIDGQVLEPTRVGENVALGDRLVFELPEKSAKQLTLQLPAASFRAVDEQDEGDSADASEEPAGDDAYDESIFDTGDDERAPKGRPDLLVFTIPSDSIADYTIDEDDAASDPTDDGNGSPPPKEAEPPNPYEDQIPIPGVHVDADE